MQTSFNALLEFHCETTQELLARIDAVVAVDATTSPEGYAWAFRGQADARWRLDSSALRPGTALGFRPGQARIESSGNGKCSDQMNGEIVALRQFAELADRVGLPVPGMSKFFREDGFALGSYQTCGLAGGIGVAEWPKAEMLELLALAQHHGVPTRLLDFTYSPQVALFFAADDFLQRRSRGETQSDVQLALWFVNLSCLYRHSMDFEIVEVPRAKNSYLHAQKALFILDRRIYDATSEGRAPTLDERILSIKEAAHPILVKATLPGSEAENSLRYLSRQGIDRPHLMPSYSEVVTYLKGLCGEPKLNTHTSLNSASE